MYLCPCLEVKTALVYDYAICRERDRGRFLCDRSLLHNLTKKKKYCKETTSANTKLYTSRSHASSQEKQNLIQFGLGDATGACAVWMQTEFMRGREEGYQKGKEQHVGENIDLTGGKWARSCQNKSIWRDSNTD